MPRRQDAGGACRCCVAGKSLAGSLSAGNGKAEKELQAAVASRTYRDRALVEADDVADDGESQSRTARIACTSLVNAVETLEKTVQLFGFGNAASVVREGEVEETVAAVALGDGDRHVAARVVDDVVGQVAEHGVDQTFVAGDGQSDG